MQLNFKFLKSVCFVFNFVVLVSSNSLIYENVRICNLKYYLF